MGTVDTTEPGQERVTTVKVYESDRDWLVSRQRRASADQNKQIPMCDILRALITAIQAEGQGA
jgi:hypothetical protein